MLCPSCGVAAAATTQKFCASATRSGSGGRSGAGGTWALCELDFVRFVGGENPDAKAAADEARDIFTRLGAPAFLRRLNEAVGLPVG